MLQQYSRRLKISYIQAKRTRPRVTWVMPRTFLFNVHDVNLGIKLDFVFVKGVELYVIARRSVRLQTGPLTKRDVECSRQREMRENSSCVTAVTTVQSEMKVQL